MQTLLLKAQWTNHVVRVTPDELFIATVNKPFWDLRFYALNCVNGFIEWVSLSCMERVKCKHKARDDNFPLYQVTDKILSISNIGRVSGLQSALFKDVFALNSKKFHSGGGQLNTYIG